MGGGGGIPDSILAEFLIGHSSSWHPNYTRFLLLFFSAWVFPPALFVYLIFKNSLSK